MSIDGHRRLRTVYLQTRPPGLMLLDGSPPPSPHKSQLAQSHKINISELPPIAHALSSFKRVALQFPDDSLELAPEVSYELERLLNLDKVDPVPILFVLADTTCGSCCVDEVAAEHYAAGMNLH